MPKCVHCRKEFEPTFLGSGKPHRCCPACRAHSRKYQKARVDRNREVEAEYLRKLRRRYREEAFAAYGGKCACCGEASYEFLTIDHPDGGGRKERVNVNAPGGASFARYLAKAGYPEGYRVLCHNCNSAYGYYGYCPHTKVVSLAN